MLLGVPANVGGVGIAMLLLIFVGSYLGKRGALGEDRAGRGFWSAVYPIVVAMAAQQNVLGALSGGPAYPRRHRRGRRGLRPGPAARPLRPEESRRRPPLKPRTSVQG